MTFTTTLEITNGPLAGQKFDFTGRARCLIGRGPDCTIQIPEGYARVSRHHCVLELSASHATVQDLRSLNGTYLNGDCIGRRAQADALESPGGAVVPTHLLKNQDRLLLGGGQDSETRNLALRVHLSASSSRATAPRATAPRATAPRATAPDIALVCAVCGMEKAAPSGLVRLNKWVCASCRDDCKAMRRHLEARDESDTWLGAITNYELLQKIGRGGFGSVFLARHRLTNRRLALKVMLPHIAQNPTLRQVFEREIENMKALRHPHVVELFEEGQEGDISYFTMEYCALGSVSDLLLRRGGTLPVGEALNLIYQATEGLQYAHQAAIPHVRLANGTYASGRGLVHRDVKPCNLLLAQVNGQTALKVGDYGLSKAWEQAGYSGITRPGTRAGSFAYQPRQQVRGYRDSQPEVDVWATAATLYFLLTGATPRDFPPHIAPELVVLQHPVVKIRDRKPALPQRLADVLDSVLADEADLAVKNMADFRRGLQSAT